MFIYIYLTWPHGVSFKRYYENISEHGCDRT